MALPICFSDVTYFKNAFRGDLVVTPGIIYYIPRMNDEKWDEVPAVAKVVVGHEVALILILEKAMIRLRREIAND